MDQQHGQLVLWFNLLRFCLTVYSVQVSDVPDLQQRMQNGFDPIHTTPGIFSESGNQGIRVRRANSGVEVLSGHFEQFFLNIQMTGNRKSCFGRPMFVKLYKESL